jgi:hypothetical protein
LSAFTAEIQLFSWNFLDIPLAISTLKFSLILFELSHLSVLSINPIRKNSSEKLGEPRLYAEAIPSFSVTSPPTRVGAGIKGWGLI